VNLSSRFVGQLGGGFDFHDDLAETDEVRSVDLSQSASLVTQVQFLLGSERDALESQFECQAFLVNRFDKSAPLLFLGFEAGSRDLVGFFIEHNFWHR